MQQDMLLSATLDLLTVAIVLVNHARDGSCTPTTPGSRTWMEHAGRCSRDGDCLLARDPKAASDLKEHAIVKVA